ncbi:asparagine synthase-related protein [Shigella flexneri]
METRVPFLDKNSLMWRCILTHRIKCAVTANGRKHILRESSEAYLPAERHLAAEEQFSDGVGYS